MYTAIHIPSEYNDLDPHSKFVCYASSPYVIQQAIVTRYITVATEQGVTLGNITSELQTYDTMPDAIEHMVGNMEGWSCLNIRIGDELFIVTSI